MDQTPARLSAAELAAEGGFALPDKQVISLLNLDVDLDVALDLAAPIDLAVAANAQAALPINASVSADVLTVDSVSAAQATQATSIEQYLSGDAVAEAPQTATVDQGGTDTGGTDGGTGGTGGTSGTDGGTGGGGTDGGTGGTTDPVDQVTGSMDQLAANAGDLMSGGLLNVNVDAAVDADLAAPVAGAVAANANVAAPINASVSANIGSIGSESVAVADQTAIITQTMEDVSAEAVADQDATVTQ